MKIFRSPVRRLQVTLYWPIKERMQKYRAIKWLTSYLFGDDIFISYSRDGGVGYAEVLARTLLSKYGYSCRLDLRETLPGTRMPMKLLRGIQKSRMLVVIATEMATKSKNVGKEIKVYKRTHQTNMSIIPVDFGSVVGAIWYPRIEGLPPGPEETLAALEKPSPSTDVLERIHESFHFTRRNRRLFMISVVSILLILTLFAVGLGSGVYALTKLVEAGDAQMVAGIAQVEAAAQERAAKEAAKEAEKQRIAAAIAKSNADNQSLIADFQAGRAETAQQLEEEANRNALEQQKIAASRRLASRADRVANDQVDLSLLLAHAAYEESPTFEAKRSLLSVFQAHPNLDLMLGVANPSDDASHITHLAFTPDGRTLISADSKGHLVFWDVLTRQQATEATNFTSKIDDIALSREGKKLATISAGRISLWDVETRKRMAMVSLGTQPSSGSQHVALHPDGKLMVTDGPPSPSSPNGALHLWNITDLQHPVPTHIFSYGPDKRGRNQLITSLAFSTDGKTLVGGGSLGSLWFWEIEDGKFPRLIGEFETQQQIKKIAFSVDDKRLTALCEQGQLVVWNAEELTSAQVKLTELYRFEKRGGGFAFSWDGRLLASASDEDYTRLSVWGVDSPARHGERSLLDIAIYRPGISALAFTPDGRSIVSGNDDGTITFWKNIYGESLSGPVLAKELDGNERQVTSTAFSSNGKFLSAGDETDAITVRQVSGDSSAVLLPESHNSKVRSLAFSPDGSLLASSSTDGAIGLWDARRNWQPQWLKTSATIGTNGALAQLASNDIGEVSLVTFTDNGKTLISVGPRSELVFWDVGRRQAVRELSLPRGIGKVSGLAASRDGRKIVIGGFDDGAMYLYDLGRRSRGFHPLHEHEKKVIGAAFSDDGKLLASVDESGLVILWKLGLDDDICFMTRPWDGGIESIAFSQKDRTLALGVSDALVLWDVESRTKIGEIGAPGTGQNLSFSADGRQIAMGSSNGRTILWDSDYESWSRRARRIANRDFEVWENLEQVKPKIDSGCSSSRLTQKERELRRKGK